MPSTKSSTDGNGDGVIGTGLLAAAGVHKASAAAESANTRNRDVMIESVVARIAAVYGNRWRIILVFASFALLTSVSPPVGAASRDVKLADGTLIPVEVHTAASAGESLLLWLPSGFNSHAAEAPLALELAKRGIEVWQADMLAARLLPPLESSLDEIPDNDIVQLIDSAAQASGRRVYLLASARAGIVALRGANAWRRSHPQRRSLGGVVLLHPNLFTTPPEPGSDGIYHAAVGASQSAVFILQPELSPWRWRLDALVPTLAQSGAEVFTRLLPEVRDRFYFRPDATAREQRESERLPQLIVEALAKLRTASAGTQRAARAPNAIVAAEAPRARALRPYRGNPTPPPLDLVDLDGKRHVLRDYLGQVVVLNFWASWCPPCVHEMPSMQRLKHKFAGRPLQVLAVNMGEDEKVVRAFLREKIKVDFPVPMDRDGAALKRWKVFVFPTSFVLGLDGKIRYALFGELEWDDEATTRVIESLLPR